MTLLGFLRGVGATALLSSSFQAQALDLVVKEDDHYFKNWIFNVSDNPRGCFNGNILDSNGSITGTLGPLSYEVTMPHATGPDAPPKGTTGWVDCDWGNFGYYIPAGNDLPSVFHTNHNRTGAFRTQLDSPLRMNSVLFFQDFDGTEVAEISFRSCSGNLIDASNFDFLRVSDPTDAAGDITIPKHTRGAAAWLIASRAAPVAAGGEEGVAYYGSSFETSGIVIRSAEVCQIDVINTQYNAGGSLSAGHHFWLGMPPVPSGGTAPVPTLNEWLLVAMLGAVGCLGARRLRAPRP